MVEHAHWRGTPVRVIKLGTTRADHLLAAKLEQGCDEFLEGLLRAT